ncbi:MAG: lipid-A-disaccharide synthase [Holosporaceae bacterium]|jgi:lipid-A-disaccharide synthase|nr:lipid-A-disaccharide synthase [Holosporaceae bacterium]
MTIGIVCGGGEYPRLVAQSCRAKNLSFCLILLEEFCDPHGWPPAKKLTINFGEIGKAIDFFHKNSVKKVIFAGHAKRPDFSKLSIDSKGRKWLLKLGMAIFAGDDALLRGISDLLRAEGFELMSGTDLLDDAFLGEGVFSQRRLSESNRKDIQIGFESAKKLGMQDIGQSSIVFRGKILGTEDADGTDALIERCAKLRKSSVGGILVKVSKPQQDNRFDLPTVGVDTIDMLRKYGFDGLVVEAGKCIILNREAVVDRVNEFGMLVVCVDADFSKKKIFIIAGEASGDYLGGKLMKDIREVSPVNVEFFGVGGECMEKAGLKKMFSISELSIIGIFEVLRKIFHVKKLIGKTARAIGEYKPHALVTIDSSGFTHRVDKKIKKIEEKIPIIHYVSPPVWAWRSWRAKSMRKFIDKLLVLFPFEKKLFDKHGLKTVFVGHPVATDPDFEKPSLLDLQKFTKSVCGNGRRSAFKIITLLPGSRISEIEKHLPVMGEFARLMEQEYTHVRFIIPAVEDMAPRIEFLTNNWERKPLIVKKKCEKNLAYHSSDLAVAASGTVTLELARVGLPAIVIYKTSAITYAIVKFLLKTPWICLINILAREKIVPELLQNECRGEIIFAWAKKILSSARESEKQKKTFQKIMEALETTPRLAAMEVLNAIKKDTS